MNAFKVTCCKCGAVVHINKDSAKKHLNSFAWPNKTEWIKKAVQDGGITFVARYDAPVSLECVCGNVVFEY